MIGRITFTRPATKTKIVMVLTNEGEWIGPDDTVQLIANMFYNPNDESKYRYPASGFFGHQAVVDCAKEFDAEWEVFDDPDDEPEGRVY